MNIRVIQRLATNLEFEPARVIEKIDDNHVRVQTENGSYVVRTVGVVQVGEFGMITDIDFRGTSVFVTVPNIVQLLKEELQLSSIQVRVILHLCTVKPIFSMLKTEIRVLVNSCILKRLLKIQTIEELICISDVDLLHYFSIDSLHVKEIVLPCYIPIQTVLSNLIAYIPDAFTGENACSILMRVNSLTDVVIKQWSLNAVSMVAQDYEPYTFIQRFLEQNDSQFYTSKELDTVKASDQAMSSGEDWLNRFFCGFTRLLLAPAGGVVAKQSAVYNSNTGSQLVSLSTSNCAVSVNENGHNVLIIFNYDTPSSGKVYIDGTDKSSLFSSYLVSYPSTPVLTKSGFLLAQGKRLLIYNWSSGTVTVKDYSGTITQTIGSSTVLATTEDKYYFCYSLLDTFSYVYELDINFNLVGNAIGVSVRGGKGSLLTFTLGAKYHLAYQYFWRGFPLTYSTTWFGG